MSWLDDVHQHGNDRVKTLLIANKCDLESKRQGACARAAACVVGMLAGEGQGARLTQLWGGGAVTQEEGQAFAKKHGLLYLETSAKTGFQVEQAFLLLANTIFNSLDLARDVSQLSDADIKQLEQHGVKVGPRRPAVVVAPSVQSTQAGSACCT
nr:Ras- protein Rab-2A [Polyrhizophydium stewartii]